MRFSTENEGTWFYFDDLNFDEGGIQLRILTPQASQMIDKKVTKKRVEYKLGNRFSYKETDDEKFSEEMWNYCIVNWTNVELDGKEIECNKENKLNLMKNSIQFAKFIADSIEKLTEVTLNEKDEEVKN